MPYKDKQKLREYQRKWDRARRTRERNEALLHYSNGNPKCSCCGERITEFLTIDHINDKGKQHRKSIGSYSKNFYRWLKLNNYPDGYQVLCYNCNIAKSLYGECPHRKEINRPIHVEDEQVGGKI